MSKAKRLQELLKSPKTTYAIEAHSPISALIGQEAGFEMLWGSGLTISSSLGHRDCNELSWTNLCDHYEYISDCTKIPMLVDADTGFGNFNNVRMLVSKLNKIGIAGMSIEDKIFPKTNSFLDHNQKLAPVEEFVGKIQAAKDSQKDPDFCVIARTEAFIAGMGLQETLDRAYAYKEAGADAILVHSKKTTAEEIKAFCSHWEEETPLVIVPTTYASTPSTVFDDLGISMIIWANHLLRASVTAMQAAARKIYDEKSVGSIGQEIASVKDLFDMMNEDELREAEKKYLAPKITVPLCR